MRKGALRLGFVCQGWVQGQAAKGAQRQGTSSAKSMKAEFRSRYTFAKLRS